MSSVSNNMPHQITKTKVVLIFVEILANVEKSSLPLPTDRNGKGSHLFPPLPQLD